MLDWSAFNGLLAVALNDTVYLWNQETSDIKQLMSCPEDVSVSSVAFCSTENSPLIALGLSNNEVHLWDLDLWRCVRILKQHSGRVGALAWKGANFLSSGSADALVIHNDLRMPNSLFGRGRGHS